MHPAYLALLAVVFVLALTGPLNNLIYTGLLKQGALSFLGLGNVDLTFLKTGDRCWIAPETGGNQGPNLRPPSGKEFYGSRAVGALVTVESGKSHPGKLVLVSGAIVRNVMIEEGSQRDFGLNCFEWLAERRLIVPIRKDTMKLATIDLGTNEDEKVTRLARAFWLQILWTPLFFLGLGILVGWRRRRI